MAQHEVSDIDPLPKRSFVKIIAYLLLQFFLVPVQRVLHINAIPGWDVSTQISTNFLRYGLTNEIYQARKVEETTTWLMNLGFKDPVVDIETEEFHGAYVGGEPSSDNAAIVLYFHGGGYCLSSVKTCQVALTDIHKAMQTETGYSISLFALEYTRAPEAKFPTQINEAVAAYKYLRENFPSRPLFVMGDSAGGNLALALLLKLKQDNIQQPDAAITVSPWVQMDAFVDPTVKDVDTDFVTYLAGIHDTREYLPEPITVESIRNPLVSPMFGDFSGTCPIFVHYGGYEFFLPQIEQFIENARRQTGVDLTAFKEPYAPHVTPLLPKIYKQMGTKGISAIVQYMASRLQDYLYSIV